MTKHSILIIDEEQWRGKKLQENKLLLRIIVHMVNLNSEMIEYSSCVKTPLFTN